MCWYLGFFMHAVEELLGKYMVVKVLGRTPSKLKPLNPIITLKPQTLVCESCLGVAHL